MHLYIKQFLSMYETSHTKIVCALLTSHIRSLDSDKVQRQNSADVLSTYWASALNKCLVAAVAATHVSTVHDNTVTWLREANNTVVLYLFPNPVFGDPGPLRWSSYPLFFCWQSLKFSPVLFQLPLAFSVAVISSTDPQKDCGPQQGGSNGQPFTPISCRFQLSLQRVKVHETQNVLRTIRGRLKTQGSISSQYQLPCPYKSCTHLKKKSKESHLSTFYSSLCSKNDLTC